MERNVMEAWFNYKRKEHTRKRTQSMISFLSAWIVNIKNKDHASLFIRFTSLQWNEAWVKRERSKRKKQRAEKMRGHYVVLLVLN